MTITFIIVAALAILVASAIFSMTGQGGGVLYVPILLALGMGVQDAATVSLFVIVASSISAVIMYWRRRMIDWKLALAIEPPTMALAFVGGLLANHINEAVLKIIFAGALIIAGFLMRRPVKEKGDGVSRGWGSWNRKVGDKKYSVRLPGLMPITALAGFAAGLIGIAGGIFKFPAMVLVGRVPLRIAIATSEFMVAFTALAGFAGHVSGGSFNFFEALPLAVTAFVGGHFGSSLSTHVKVPTLRNFFALLLFLISIGMIASVLVK